MQSSDAAFEAEARLESVRGVEDDGERAVEVAVGGIPMSADDSETTPLIANGIKEGREETDFSHIVWYKRPSIYWLLPPFFLTTLAFGGVIAPKTTLTFNLVCRDYFREQMVLDPGFFVAPIQYGDGTVSQQCMVDGVKDVVAARAASLSLGISLITGILSAFVSPHLGSLSDRYGRRPLLIIASIGTILNEIISIVAATKPETFAIEWFYVGAAVDGFTGSFTVAMAIANSYATDCTLPALRNVAFGKFHGSLFAGIAIGPILAGLLVTKTHSIASVFYALLAVHISFGVFVLTVIPESLSKKKQLASRDRHASNKATAPGIFKVFAPLKIFWPVGPGTSAALRRNLVLLAAIDTIAFGVAMGAIGIVMIYMQATLRMDTLARSVFMTVANGSRAVVLVAVLPILMVLFRRYRSAKRSSGSDIFDLSIIRVSMFFDIVGYTGYVLARTSHQMIGAGAVAALGGMGSASLQAALTKHVPNDRTGQLLGAIGMLHALARVVAPLIFSPIYIQTATTTFPQAVFVCLTATFVVAFVLSWLVRPHIYWDEIASEQPSTTDDNENNE